MRPNLPAGSSPLRPSLPLRGHSRLKQRFWRLAGPARASPIGSPRAPSPPAASPAVPCAGRAMPSPICSRAAASATAGAPPRPVPSARRQSPALSGSRWLYLPSATRCPPNELDGHTPPHLSTVHPTLRGRYRVTPRSFHRAWTPERLSLPHGLLGTILGPHGAPLPEPRSAVFAWTGSTHEPGNGE
jgi:hypothetical protein